MGQVLLAGIAALVLSPVALLALAWLATPDSPKRSVYKVFVHLLAFTCTDVSEQFTSEQKRPGNKPMGRFERFSLSAICYVAFLGGLLLLYTALTGEFEDANQEDKAKKSPVEV